MPAKLLSRVAEKGTFSHIYNEGVEKRIIFNDNQDYCVFLDYIKDYLSPPSSPESFKKTFTIKGRTFQGTPHLLKNYLNKVELIAYRLTPTHFHLILRQNTPNSLGNFIRSLCTRYSIYFNKKYNHTGALFNGPYKSIHVEDLPQLLHYTRFLHRPPDNGEDPIKIYTSYSEYLGQKGSPWVNTKVVLSIKGRDDYKDFVERYQLDEGEKDLLEGTPIEQETAELSNKTPPEPDLKPQPGVFEYGLLTGIFLILLSVGLNHVHASQAERLTDTTVLSETTSSAPSPIPTPTPLKIMLTVNTDDASSSANIRKEPNLQSEIIGMAKNGDIFEAVSINTEWDEIKLGDGSTGFISSELIQIDQTSN